MRLIADLHIHSRFSRACSGALTLPNIAAACRRKGVDIIATGDFTHPEWFREIEEELEETAPGAGLYRLRSADEDMAKVNFVLATELALIYKQGERTRRVHMAVQAPGLGPAREFMGSLDRDFNVRSDGRPILGMSIEALFERAHSIDRGFLIYPAHIWTPWFSIFGSKSGFDSLEEAFGEARPHLFAYETGLSSDPPMNWRVSSLDGLALLSNSDAHSLENIAREANIFELPEATHRSLVDAVRGGSPAARRHGSRPGLVGTIEFHPEEGMYHYDGHRECGVRLAPEETKRRRGVCPKCGKPVTIGVEYRVGELADRPEGYRPEGAADFHRLVELDKVAAEAMGVKSRRAARVRAVADRIIRALGNELYVLMDAPIESIAEVSDPRIAEGVRRMRAGELHVEPGFDGQYGTVRIWDDSDPGPVQGGLF